VRRVSHCVAGADPLLHAVPHDSSLALSAYLCACVCFSCLFADIAEADNMARLHLDITNCESVLSNMEGMLQHFQHTLGGISREIRHLQDRSMEMNVQLNNRKAVAGKIGMFLDNVAVSERFIQLVCEAEINPDYVGVLEQLSTKLMYDTVGRCVFHVFEFLFVVWSAALHLCDSVPRPLCCVVMRCVALCCAHVKVHRTSRRTKRRSGGVRSGT